MSRDRYLTLEVNVPEGVDPLSLDNRWLYGSAFVVEKSIWIGIVDSIRNVDRELAEWLVRLIPTGTMAEFRAESMDRDFVERLKEYILQPNVPEEICKSETLEIGRFSAYYGHETLLKSLLAVCRHVTACGFDYRAGPMV